MPRNHGHAAWIYTSSFGGGLVDGDRVMMDVGVAEGASAFLSTQASTKVYRSPRIGAHAELSAHVGADALLVVAPDPVVCFAASRYRQVQSFDLAPDAALLVIDWMSSGRRAAGERWAFRDYHARLSVRAAGALLLHDELLLSADEGELASRMGRFDVLATAVVAGAALRAVAAEIVSRVDGTPVARRADRLLAATWLGGDAHGGARADSDADAVGRGCVLRIAGTSVEQVGRTLRELLAFVPALLGDDPWARKW